MSRSQALRARPVEAQTRVVTGVVFSKDRPLQLDATLSSWKRHVCDAECVSLTVLYATSSQASEELYKQVFREHPDITFVRERLFQDDLLSILYPSRHVLFLVDDCLFVRSTSIGSAVAALEGAPDAIGVSFRLGTNTRYCYVTNAQQRVPAMHPLQSSQGDSSWLRYRWTECEHDFAYPLEVSSSLYRSTDVLPILKSIQFRNPNQLEDHLSRRAIQFVASHPFLIAAATSSAFCNPCNRVQHAYPNRAGSSTEASSEAFMEAYARGKRVLIADLDGHIPTGCHEEISLPLALMAQPLGHSVSDESEIRLRPASIMEDATDENKPQQQLQSKRRMRTAYIAYLPDADRGGQVNLIRLMESLDRKTHQSLVLLPGPGSLEDRLRTLGIPCFVTQALHPKRSRLRYSIRTWVASLFLARTIRPFRPDVIYVDALQDIRFAKKVSRWAGGKIVWHAQTAMASAEDVALIRLADVVVAVAPHVQELVKRLAPDMRVECVPNAVDVNHFSPGREESLRRQYGVASENLVVLYVGGLYKPKGVHDLVDAFASVRAEIPSALLWVVGAGPEERALREKASRLDDPAAVHFFGVRTDINRFYRASDVFCLPSHSEGLPLSVLEAMSTGTACIGSDVPGIAQLLSDGCGLMAPARNTAQLADTITAALRSQEIRDATGKRARQRVLQDYQIHRYISQFDALLCSLIK